MLSDAQFNWIHHILHWLESILLIIMFSLLQLHVIIPIPPLKLKPQTTTHRTTPLPSSHLFRYPHHIYSISQNSLPPHSSHFIQCSKSMIHQINDAPHPSYFACSSNFSLKWSCLPPLLCLINSGVVKSLWQVAMITFNYQIAILWPMD